MQPARNIPRIQPKNITGTYQEKRTYHKICTFCLKQPTIWHYFERHTCYSKKRHYKHLLPMQKNLPLNNYNSAIPTHNKPPRKLWCWKFLQYQISQIVLCLYHEKRFWTILFTPSLKDIFGDQPVS